jgi:hypothetical protein
MSDVSGGWNARLVRHDRMIVVNAVRSVFASWTNRLIALTLMVGVLVAFRSALTDRPFMLAALVVSAVAAAIGASAARLIARRLDFHASDGLLAADALARSPRRNYGLSLHALTGGGVVLGALAVRPSTILAALVGYLAGAVCGHLARRVMEVFARDGSRGAARFRPLAAFLRTPLAGALAAAPVIVTLLLVRSLEPGPVAAFAGVSGGIAALCLSGLDDGAIRFMTLSGYRAGRIIGRCARALLVFLALTVPAGLALSRPLTALIVGGVVLAALLLMTARILAYRVYARRTADLLVSIGAVAGCAAGVVMPILAPLVVIAILWRLHRRSVAATWILT